MSGAGAGVKAGGAVRRDGSSGAGMVLSAAAGLRLVAGDLNNLDQLKGYLSAAGLKWDRPTLVVSECVLAYLPVANADAVISWAASAFEDAAFLMYEPIVPHDAFGSQMVRHFAERLHESH